MASARHHGRRADADARRHRRARVELHQRFGRIGVALMQLLVIIGATVLFRMMRTAAVPPFWTYAGFLTMSMVSLVAFTMLTVAAIRLCKDTCWRRRPMVCGMAALLITPMSRLGPGAILAESMSLVPAVASLLFPPAGLTADWLREPRDHPAWWFGPGAFVVAGLTTEIVARSPLAGSMVQLIAAASSGANVNLFVPHLPPE